VGTAISPLSGKKELPHRLCCWRNITDRKMSVIAMLRQLSRWATRVLSVTIGLMRWVLITFEGFVTGVLAVVVSIVAFFVGLSAYTRYLFGQGSASGAVGWDVASLFGQHWKVTIIGVLAGIFLLGGSAGVWFFSQRVHR